VRDRENGFLKCISSKRKTRVRVSLLMNGQEDTEKATVNAFFPLPVLVKPAFRKPRSLRPEGKSGAKKTYPL